MLNVQHLLEASVLALHIGTDLSVDVHPPKLLCHVDLNFAPCELNECLEVRVNLILKRYAFPTSLLFRFISGL